jgi:glycosyltransferase involved in cell wall biosynthesis
MDVELSVIIPVYNEEDNIIPLHQELKKILNSIGRSCEIIFVDDGSSDKSVKKMFDLFDLDPNVKIIQFKRNFGQSAAMKAGFDHAAGALIITMDADLQNDPSDIAKIIDVLESDNYDVVCGWRRFRHDPFFKKIFSRYANKLRILLTGESIHDSGCTLRVYRRECISDLELYGELHRYIPAILTWKGYLVGEIEINHRERAFGVTKYSWDRIMKGFLDLIVISFWQKYSFRPIHVFGGSGLLLSGLGFILSLYLILSRVVLGTPLTDRPLFLLGLVLFIIGVQFIALGIIADILLKIYYGQNERKNYLITKIHSKESKNDQP